VWYRLAEGVALETSPAGAGRGGGGGDPPPTASGRAAGTPAGPREGGEEGEVRLGGLSMSRTEGLPPKLQALISAHGEVDGELLCT